MTSRGFWAGQPGPWHTYHVSVHDHAPDSDQGPKHRAAWRRGDGPEFDRVAMFSDAVFAIAMTLLAFDLRVEHVASPIDSPANMGHALYELTPRLVAFGIGFWVMAGRWMDHHGFFARLAAVDQPLMRVNLTYLAFVALLPFPTALIGEFESNPVSAVVFSTNLAVLVLLGMWTHAIADGHNLFAVPLTPGQRRADVVGHTAVAAMFLLTIPIAFISPTLQLLSWIPLSFAIHRMTPGADEG